MAHQLLVTKIQDGSSLATFQVFLKSDGYSGELTNFTIIDEKDVTPQLPHAPDFNLQQCWYELSGCDATLAFRTDVSTLPVWNLTPGVSSYHDWRLFGGLVDRTNPLNANGEIVISTNGFASAGSVVSLVLKLRKMR